MTKSISDLRTWRYNTIPCGIISYGILYNIVLYLHDEDETK